MKKFVIILLLHSTSVCNSQNLVERDIITHITDRWESITIKKRGLTIPIDSQFVNSAKFFVIDEKTYVRSEALKKIEACQKNDLILAGISLYSQLSEYKPRIIVLTKRGQSKATKRWVYNYALSESFDLKKKTVARDSIYGSGNCALLINDKLIEPTKASATFFSIDFNDIQNIGVSGGYQNPVYGEDSKNGVILIWTKNK